VSDEWHRQLKEHY